MINELVITLDFLFEPDWLLGIAIYFRKDKKTKPSCLHCIDIIYFSL